MFYAAFVVASLVLNAAISEPLPTEKSSRNLSLQQKRALVRPYVVATNRCVVRFVSHGLIGLVRSPALVNDLIGNSFETQTCTAEAQKMVEVHSELFGDGAGESFFEGPYLDVLPAIVWQALQGSAGHK